jgi:hypothetical protein
MVRVVKVPTKGLLPLLEHCQVPMAEQIQAMAAVAVHPIIWVAMLLLEVMAALALLY